MTKNQAALEKIKRGDQFIYEGSPIKIMAHEDAYCMVRRRGRSPFILQYKIVAMLERVSK